MGLGRMLDAIMTGNDDDDFISLYILYITRIFTIESSLIRLPDLSRRHNVKVTNPVAAICLHRRPCTPKGRDALQHAFRDKWTPLQRHLTQTDESLNSNSPWIGVPFPVLNFLYFPIGAVVDLPTSHLRVNVLGHFPNSNNFCLKPNAGSCNFLDRPDLCPRQSHPAI